MRARQAARIAAVAGACAAGGALTALVVRTRADVHAARRREAAAVDRARVWREMALVDDLTGIASRLAWDEALAQASCSCRPHLVLVVDLDGFKDVNDSYGHPVGDRVLCQVAGSLAAACRGRGLAARYGGDEFCALLPAASADPHAEAEQLAAELAVLLVVPAGACTPGTVTVSVGAAVLRPGGSAEEAVKAADQAMYRHKHHRDRPVVRALRVA